MCVWAWTLRFLFPRLCLYVVGHSAVCPPPSQLSRIEVEWGEYLKSMHREYLREAARLDGSNLDEALAAYEQELAAAAPAASHGLWLDKEKQEQLVGAPVLACPLCVLEYGRVICCYVCADSHRACAVAYGGQRGIWSSVGAHYDSDSTGDARHWAPCTHRSLKSAPWHPQTAVRPQGVV